MKKLELITVLLGVTFAITLLNTYLIFGVGQQIGSFQSNFALVGESGSGSGQLKETQPLEGGSAQTAPSQPEPSSVIAISADDDAVMGSESAPVTIIEFSDYECPFCARFYSQTLDLLKQNYIETGKAKLVYRDFPLSFHPNAQKAAEATECAADQGKFWEMHDKIFENQSSIGVASLKQYAKDIGLNAAEFDACLDSGQKASEVQKDFSDGQKYGVSGTPTFFINGTKLVGAQPFSAFQQIIESELAKGGA